MALGFLLFRVALFGVSVHSLAFPSPRPTAADELPAVPVEDGWSPEPTAAPDAHEILRRQNSRASTYFALPDSICGFVGTDLAAYGCGSSSTCAFLPSSPRSPGAVGCCNGEASCFFRTSCMDFKDLKNCNEDCMDDPNILKCSRQAAQFCNTVAYPGQTTDYFCDTKSFARIQSAQLSKPGGKSRSLARIVVTASTSPPTKPTSTRTNSSSKSASTTSVQDSDLVANPPDAPPGSDPSTISTAPAATSSTAVAEGLGPASSNTGAIAGGVVGGVAGLGLVIFAVLFFLRRKKDIDESTQPRIAPSPDGQGPLMSQNPQSSRTTAPSPAPSNPFSDPPPAAREDISFSQLANAFPKVPEPLSLSRPGTAATVKRPITPSQFSPLSAVTIAAATKAAALSGNNAIKQTTVTYPEPSPMSTPTGSPRSARYQPPDASSFYPNYPQYRPPSSRSQNGLNPSWPASPTQGGGGSPASTYSPFPVSPVSVVSALVSNPPDKDIGIPNFPLVLQPGMGVQRLPPGTVRQVTLQRGPSARRRRESQAQGQDQSGIQKQDEGGKDLMVPSAAQ
ncbi:hypothetical protein QBC43DRAFT_21038 [Cladorrhinum sp. PSN259]|nr:hypothetical protein QBC43DRAFT_21038 [Cladorrhinum sp. PSN259]